MSNGASIGIFDSGYGGLTILSEIRALMPEYNYIYLGDNARTPYGTRSFDVVYRYTLENVKKLFSMGCSLVIIACNTASAKALRTIQQNDLPHLAPNKRVLGVIRPTTEIAGTLTRNGHLGLFGTEGTIDSMSYNIEIARLFPHVKVTGQACPMWVPIIENSEAESDGTDYFVEKYCSALVGKDPLIDTVILACTHYPILKDKIQRHLPSGIRIVSQGPIVAESLRNYLTRHSEIESQIEKGGNCLFYTTENAQKFIKNASIFLNEQISAETII
ncbi:MAG: glutamate racemase [Paludibacteraceae bacterium]|nr:glutamate racemase [Paludibacteraceae bacterium]